MLYWKSFLALGTLVLILSACANNTPASQSSSLLATATLPNSQPALTPVSGLLDPIPSDCQLLPPPETLTYDQLDGFTRGVTLRGGGPVWVTELANPAILHLNSRGAQPFPGTKTLWVVGPNPIQPVTLRGKDQKTGTPLWLQIFDQPPETTVTLIPGQSNRGGATTADGKEWEIWGVGLIFLKAGCYELEASWSGGKWLMTIAAGR